MESTSPGQVAASEPAGSGQAVPNVYVRPEIPAMRWILLVAAFFVLNAGIQLFIWTEHTEMYFAWTIKSPLMAAFMGAAYWASGVIEFLAWRDHVWARARTGAVAVFVFTTLTLIVTLVHIDRFHFSSLNLDTLFFTWMWLAVYICVPVAMVVILWQQLRAPGDDPARTAPLPGWFRAALALQAAVMLVLGVLFLVLPDTMSGVWPWALTTLTGRVLGAWLVGWGLVAALACRENDFFLNEPAMASLTVLGVLELIALARFPSAVSWTSPKTIFYLVFVVSLLLVGAYGWVLGRRSRRLPAAPQGRARA